MRPSLRTPIKSGWRASCWALLWTSVAVAQEQGVEEGDVVPPPLETRVQEQRPPTEKVGDAFTPPPEWSSASQPEDLLEGMGGVALAREGGPLAPVRISMRGLAGPRTQISLGELALDDPATGTFDAAFLPFFMTSRISEEAATGTEGVPGSRMHLEMQPARQRSLQAHLGWGTLHTFRAQLGAHYTSLDDGQYTAALQFGRTDGNFLFRPFSPSMTSPAPARVRANNDQQRGSVYLRAEQSVGPVVLNWSAFGGSHQGGIPGFATAPTDALRGETEIFHSQIKFTTPAQSARFSLQAMQRLSSMIVHSPRSGQYDRMTSSSASLQSVLMLPPLQDATFRFDSSLRVSAERSRVLGSSFERDGGRAWGSASLRLPRWQLRLFANASASYFSDMGWLPEGGLGVEFSPLRQVQSGLQWMQSGRPPTLDELYAPRGLVVGNPKLNAESGFESEVYLRFHRNRMLDGRVSLFAGRMNDAIVFLNRNAFEVMPVNTGPLLRAGVLARASIRPHRWFEMRLAVTSIWSRLEVTQAPLPTVPGLLGRLEHRWGPADGIHFAWSMRYRGQTFSSPFGTLPIPPYLLWDGMLRMPLVRDWFVSLSVTNVLDMQTAQDVNLLPLPGRQVFCSLEYRYAAFP